MTATSCVKQESDQYRRWKEHNFGAEGDEQRLESAVVGPGFFGIDRGSLRVTGHGAHQGVAGGTHQRAKGPTARQLTNS